MNCPECGHEHHKVIDSRDSRSGKRRRRVCDKCGGRFTTYEAIVGDLQRRPSKAAREQVLGAVDDMAAAVADLRYMLAAAAVIEVAERN